MNNRTWMKVRFTLFEDPRLKILAHYFGEHEALSIFLRLLWQLYDVFDGRIDLADPDVCLVVCDACKTDEDTLRALVAKAAEPSVGFFSKAALDEFGTIQSDGVNKEAAEVRRSSENGTRGGRPGKASKPPKTTPESGG